MTNVKTLLLEQDLNTNNIPYPVLEIELENPHFNKGIFDNRVYHLTGKHTHILGEYNDETMKSNVSYELVINLNKIRTTIVNDLLTYLNDEKAFDKKYAKELTGKYIEYMNIPIMTYTVKDSNFTHVVEYNVFGGVINHS